MLSWAFHNQTITVSAMLPTGFGTQKRQPRQVVNDYESQSPIQ